jgi:hypothetical protein
MTTADAPPRCRLQNPVAGSLQGLAMTSIRGPFSESAA